MGELDFKAVRVDKHKETKNKKSPHLKFGGEIKNFN
jgi:hypothetical protein